MYMFSSAARYGCVTQPRPTFMKGLTSTQVRHSTHSISYPTDECRTKVELTRIHSPDSNPLTADVGHPLTGRHFHSKYRACITKMTHASGLKVKTACHGRQHIIASRSRHTCPQSTRARRIRTVGRWTTRPCNARARSANASCPSPPSDPATRDDTHKTAPSRQGWVTALLDARHAGYRRKTHIAAHLEASQAPLSKAWMLESALAFLLMKKILWSPRMQCVASRPKQPVFLLFVMRVW